MDITTKILLVICQALSFAELRSSAFEGPENTIARLGDNVTMRCSSGTNGCSDIIGWNRLHKASTSLAVATDIVRNKHLTYGDTRYSVDDSTSGCHVIIRNVQYNDSGRYSCEAVLPDKTTSRKYGSLVVFKSSPKCEVRLPSASNATVMEGDKVTFTCESTYEGTEGNMTWTDVEKGRHVVERLETHGGNTTHRLSYSVTAGPSGVAPLVCEVQFPFQSKATDVNPLTTSCQTPAVDVLFSARNVRLYPLSSAFSPGSVVTCQADGNPPPAIKWQSLNTQNASTTWRDIPEANGSQVVVGSDLHVRYRCVASNFVGNSSHSDISCQISVGEADERGYSTGVAIAVGFGTGFLAAFLLMFLAWFFHKRLFRRSQSEDLDHKTNALPSTAALPKSDE